MIARGQFNDETMIHDGHRVWQRNQPAIHLAGECYDRSFDLGGVMHPGHHYIYSEVWRRRSGCTPKFHIGSRLGMQKNKSTSDVGTALLEQFQPFASHRGFEIGKPRNIATWLGQAVHKSTSNRIGNLNK